jgi:hypothetical protein
MTRCEDHWLHSYPYLTAGISKEPNILYADRFHSLRYKNLALYKNEARKLS